MLKLFSERSSETFDFFKPCNNETTFYLSYNDNKGKRIGQTIFSKFTLTIKTYLLIFGDENHESKPIEFQDLEKVRW